MPEFTIHLDDPQDAIDNLRRMGGMGLAAQIEAQLPKAPVEEPTEFGSIVAARVDAHWEQVQWHVSPMNGKHYWESEFGAVGLWSELRDVEVLRVGIGEPAPSADGVVLSTLKLAEIRMFGTVDGDLLSDESELPVGELRRLLWTEDADDITPWENDAGLPAPSPAEAVEADKAQCVGFADAPPHAAHRWLDATDVDLVVPAWYDCPGKPAPEPSPMQVEAEPQPLTSLPPGSVILANVRRWSGSLQWPPSTERVTLRLDANGYWEAPDGDHAAPFTVPPQCAEYIDLIEVVDTLAPAEDDPIEALVQEFAPVPVAYGKGVEFDRSRLREFAARVLEVGGQQPGVPAEKVRALRSSLTGHRDRATDALRRDMLTDFITDVAGLLPEEPTS